MILKPPQPAPPPFFGETVTLINTFERLWMTALLINNREKPLTVREFSALSGLSLGFISKYANLLRQKGFLRPGQRIRVMEAGQLLNMIRDLYFFEGNTLTPYYSEVPRDELLKRIKQADKKWNYALTRMCGASLIAPYVRYQLVDFYVARPEEIAYWKDHLKLVDVEISGNINLVVPQDPRILAQIQTVKGWCVVNNVQLYLDLYKYPARGREQAEFLREQVLKI
ncbi:MAG: hypothetical protein HY541_08235 [Deltaproteobacteria bacterium]|nr:hypothetical protein [Deltaproteobacteria bacterium]